MAAVGGINPGTVEGAEQGPAREVKLTWAWQPHRRINEFA